MIPTEEQIKVVLENKEAFVEIIEKYKPELGLSDNFSLSQFELKHGLDKATKILDIVIDDQGQEKQFRANASTMFSREHGYRAVALIKDDFSDDFLVTQKICYDPGYNMVIYEKIPGDTLLHEIQGAKTLDLVDLEEKIKLCALWLKKLHELKVEENFSEFKWQIMQDYLAKYYNEGKNLDEIIEVRELILAGKPQIFIHGDFQTSNAIINNGKIWFIDFNDSATGNSAIDVSGFLAQLRIELYRRGDLEIFDKLKQIFLENYSLVQESSQELRACLGLQYLKILSVLCWLEDPEEKTELFDEVYKYWKENAQI